MWDPQKSRMTTAVGVLSAVIAISLSIRLFSVPESTDSDYQVDGRAGAPAVQQKPATNKAPWAQTPDSADDGLFSVVEWRNQWDGNREEYPGSYTGA